MVNASPPAIPSFIRVLVVDDDPDTLVVMGKLLSLIGIDAVPVATCAAARDAARAEPFTLVICDHHLPDGDGLALCWNLKQQYGCRTIVMSGTDEPAEGLPLSVDLWITKPVQVKALHAAVGRLIGA